jgi:hypothetical protein
MTLFILSFLTAVNLINYVPQKMDPNYYELRIYHCNPGKLNDLIARFQNHTTKLFEKHGMKNIGYWVPAKQDNMDLYYILSYPNKESREISWKNFIADPEWEKVRAESEQNGKILASIESIFLSPEDFSPKVKKSVKSPMRTFEMRTYYCLPGKLPALESRFRDHTLKLFKKHGMTNIAYWKSIEKDGSQPKLIYLLAHESQDAAKKSFDSFRLDPEWIKARDASEKEGKIVEKVESIMMSPLRFSKYQ